MRASYNRDLIFKLRIGNEGPSSSIEDIVLEGDGEKVVQTIFGQGNKLPKISVSNGFSNFYYFELFNFFEQYSDKTNLNE